MVKIRLMGLPDEVDQAAAALAEVLEVIELSAPYPCRGNSRQVRVYAEVRIPAARTSRRTGPLEGAGA